MTGSVDRCRATVRIEVGPGWTVVLRFFDRPVGGALVSFCEGGVAHRFRLDGFMFTEVVRKSDVPGA